MAITKAGSFTYTTRTGDTFDSLALRFYNSEKLSTWIIANNPDCARVLIFDYGVTLKIPILSGVSSAKTVAPWRT